MADGWITIGTELSTDKFDKQIIGLEKKMKKEEDKKIVIEAKLSSQERDLEKQREKVDELADAYQKLKSIQDSIEGGKATPQQFLDYQGLTSQYGSLEQLGETFDKALTSQDLMEQKVEATKIKYGEIDSNVTDIKAKIEGINLQKQQSEINKMKDGFENVGKSLQKSIKNAGRLALGIFGIRSAYLAVRRASSDLANYDKQYAANIEYIRYALTQMIAPVLRWIVQMAATLLNYINAIMQGWFGINLFANSSAENFKKMKASAGGVSKAVKDIKKQLAGFDEMNVLSEQGEKSSGGGAGGGTFTPNIELGELQEKPVWLQWIIDNKELVIGALTAITTTILLMKLGINGLFSLGIGLILGGIVTTIMAIVKFIKDPSWKNFGKILEGLTVILIGVAVAMLAVNAANPVAWIVLAIAAIVALVAAIIKYWDVIKAWAQKAGQWFNDKIIQPIANWFKGLWDGIVNGAKACWDWITNIFKNIGNWFSNVIKTIIDKFKQMGQKVGEVVSGAFKAVVNGVLKAVESILNFPIRQINKLIDIIRAVPGLGGLRTLPTFNLPRLAVGGIVNMPNKGTIVGGAIAGESGREGVVPLTDQQAMAELGREIGKNVLVNLTNITTMNGRVISRELKQVQNEQEFAYNL